MMRLGIRLNPPGDADVFAPDAFADVIGDPVPLKYNDEYVCTATVVGVEYRENGRLAILMLDVADPPPDDNRATQLFALAMLASATYSANLSTS